MSDGRNSRRVIAVAAPIGGGKSALVTALAQALDETVTLRFDDYEQATRKSVDELAQWLADGADFNRLEAPGLADALAVLCDGGPLAVGGNTVKQNLVFEMPLGRAWSATAARIDHLVWIDSPLDIALARRIREISSDLLRHDAQDARRGLAWIDNYLSHYISVIHHVLERQRKTVLPQADLILDAFASVETNVQKIVRHFGLVRECA